MTISFTKMHGIGNDYLVIDARDLELDWSQIATQICDRHFGVGSDGILLIQSSDVADIRMRIFNPDGSEAEACGNGIRMFAKYVIEQGLMPLDTETLVIQTLGTVGKVNVIKENGQISSVRASMGPARLKPSTIPVALADEMDIIKDYPIHVNGWSFSVTCVSMGNPHAVLFTTDPVDQFPLADIGPKVEVHPFFPARVNFEVVNVLNRNHLRMRVWERGVGETLACGTGACAVGVAGRLQDLTDSPVQVSLPGGSLQVEWDGKGDVYLLGPAEYVFKGVWDPPHAGGIK